MTLDERLARRRQRARRFGNSSWIAGASLVFLGTLLFLDNLGVLSASKILASFWPGLLIAFGVWRLTNPCRPADRLVGVIATGFGSLFLLSTLGVLHIRTHNGSWPLAILLIVAGTVAMQKALDQGGPAGRIRSGLSTTPPPSWGPAPVGPPPDATYASEQTLPIFLDDWVLGGTKKRRIECNDFRGGEVHCVLGEMIIDLRNARQPLPELPMVIEAHAVFGAIRFRVPQDWQVQMEGSAVLGAFTDKTIPTQNVNGRQPVLIVSGAAVFAEVSVDT